MIPPRRVFPRHKTVGDPAAGKYLGLNRRKERMGDKLFNGLIAALFGAISGIGSVWYLSDTPSGSPQNGAQGDSPAAFDTLEVRNLTVTDGILVNDSQSGEPLIELRDGVVLAKRQVLSNHLGGFCVMGQRIQVTTDDPSSASSPVRAELATDDKGGACLALESPAGTHSMNIGFDREETGFIISKNNSDSMMVAQAILPLPKKGTSDGFLPTQGTGDAPARLAGDPAELPPQTPLTPAAAAAPAATLAAPQPSAAPY